MNKVKEIKLKECPCCGGESKFRDIDGVSGRPISVCAYCTKCGLATKAFKVSADYCAKEEAAEAWNERHKEIYQDDFGGVTADELERALKEFMQELVTMKKPEEEYRETPKCPICGEGGPHILTLSYLPNKARAQIHCDMCGTYINIPDTSKCVGEMSELVHNEK
ncbi:MAG: Lar family restriction alleviation protein [Clostridiales bacterium]|nr:Lar family restriction alleviation protein [Clostridiales bacterium]